MKPLRAPFALTFLLGITVKILVALLKITWVLIAAALIGSVSMLKLLLQLLFQFKQ